jgi:hypothetical protein
MYRVEQHDQNAWYMDGSPCIIGTGYMGDDLRTALIDMQCRNMKQGEGKPQYRIVSDNPEHVDDPETGQNPLNDDIDYACDTIEPSDIYEALMSQHGLTEEEARSAMEW